MSGESDGLCARRRRRSVVRLLEWRAQLKFAFACCRGRRDRRTFGRAPLHAQSNSSTATTLGIGSKVYRGTSVVVAGGDPSARQQRVDLAGGMILHAGEDVREVLEGIDAARLAGRHERVQAREIRAVRAVVDEEVVLAAMPSWA
jgi:hypothetical protein